jgi:hypothetical protein
MDPGHWICEYREQYPWNTAPFNLSDYVVKCQKCEYNLLNGNGTYGNKPWTDLLAVQRMCQGWPAKCQTNSGPCERWFQLPSPPPDPSGPPTPQWIWWAVGGGVILLLLFLVI